LATTTKKNIMKKIIVIGGLSAGPSAAAKARRTDENAEIILFEKTADISYATCGIPYAISGEIEDRDRLLVVKPALLKNRFNIDVHLNEPVTYIDSKNQEIITDHGNYTYDKLIFATGGSAFTPKIPGLENFSHWAHAKSLTDFDRINTSQAFKNADHITIVGAGLIGLETAENVRKMGKNVTVVELAEQILTPWDAKFSTLGRKVLEENGIEVKLNTQINQIAADGTLELSDASSLKTSYLIISIGVRPNTQLLSSIGAETIVNGALIVNDKMETSIPNIYAAGDCAALPHGLTDESTWFPMGTHSNKAGRVAGANAAGSEKTFKGGYGTAIMKMFNYTIARTGMGIVELKRKNIPFNKTLIIASSHPGFMGIGKDMFIEIYCDKISKIVLGAELIGEKGVDKRVDVLATAIYAKLNTDDLTQLDLAYAPPFSPAKDPVIVAGFVAQNFQKTDLKEIGPNQIPTLNNTQFIDVRTEKEVENTSLIDANTIHIPLDSLRSRIDELDPNKAYVLYCAKGLRGYLASLILLHNGFKNVTNLDGGFTAWKTMN
jgi:NADPH-dependent 2,4-dienoyl-CoA reductase/sulfur reductase-like enzyme/rhodanese-related sulfurtransferase